MSLPGVLPIKDLSTRELLYGARRTTHRYELLEHDPATGIDNLIGFLDGVQSGGSLTWNASQPVKKSGNLRVADLPTAAAGLIRIADVDIVTTRIRPVRVIDGLPEMPLSIYVVTASPEQWSGTGRVYAVEMHDKSTVLAQDSFDETFTAPDDVPVLTIVKQIVESSGERIDVDASDLRTLTSPKVYGPDSSKLGIINDLLAAVGYRSLFVDGTGAFRTVLADRPATRSVRYSMLNDAEGQKLIRELTDGDESIYSPDWTRDRNVYKVPNRIKAVQRTTGDLEPLTGIATNENPDSPFSQPRRGRWIVHTEMNVETPDYGRSTIAALTEFSDDLQAFRATTSGNSAWTNKSKALADAGMAAAAILMSTMSTLPTVVAFSNAASAFNTSVYATTPVETTVDNNANTLSATALAAVTSGSVKAIADQQAFLNEKAHLILIAMSSVQASVSVKCLPIPLELLDAIIFESTPAGINARHTVQQAGISLRFDGLMALELLEVIDL